MNHIKSSLLLICMLFCELFMHACISDDLSACPPVGNVKLRFEYPQFTQKISTVDLGIYNEKGHLIKVDSLDKNNLNEYQGYQTILPDGRYSVLVWGNADTLSELEGFKSHSYLNDRNNIIINKEFITRQIPQNNDKLYYGFVDFRVDSAIATTVHFSPSFTTIDIHIKGYHLLTNQNKDLSIAVRNLPITTNAANSIGNVKATFYPLLSFDPNEHTAESIIHTFRFESNNMIYIDVLNNEDKVIYTVDLQKLIRDNHINLKTTQELTIPVNIEFRSLSAATVTLGNWTNTNLSPVM